MLARHLPSTQAQSPRYHAGLSHIRSEAPMPQSFLPCLHAFLLFSKPKVSAIVYERIADQYFRAWDRWPTFAEVEDWHQSLKAKPHHANKALSFLKALGTWAIRRQLYAGPNPAAGVKRHPTASRERVMDSREVALVLSCLDLTYPKMAAMLAVLLTTGCRLSEARVMRWEHVNLSTGKWHQPITKNGKPHDTYLPMQTRTLLQLLPKDSPYVFPGAYEHCWSRAGVEKSWAQLRGALGLKDVRLHDFRRTLSTHLYRATHDDYLVKRCINHVNKSITAVYVRITFEEVAQALQAQANRFWALEVSHADVAIPAPVMEQPRPGCPDHV